MGRGVARQRKQAAVGGGRRRHWLPRQLAAGAGADWIGALPDLGRRIRHYSRGNPPSIAQYTETITSQ